MFHRSCRSQFQQVTSKCHSTSALSMKKTSGLFCIALFILGGRFRGTFRKALLLCGDEDIDRRPSSFKVLYLYASLHFQQEPAGDEEPETSALRA